MREMVGGCCVCSDDRGWSENPLVYCDGQSCTVAVHQACYGIVTVPTGPWYCRKCESQERSVKVKCELCPSKYGALKRTDNSGWAHVVCALYIPEVRFGNVTTMEPIQLQLIPAERFNKTCYICEEKGKPSNATVGACMQCNKAGCKQQFHVTCAQSLGLLCEEAGNYLDNVKYCGYCQHHYSKLKKGGNVKTIPPYKPVSSSENHLSDSNSEKEAEVSGGPSMKSSSSQQSSSKRKTSSSKTFSSVRTNLSGAKSSSSSTAASTSSSSSSHQKTVHNSGGSSVKSSDNKLKGSSGSSVRGAKNSEDGNNSASVDNLSADKDANKIDADAIKSDTKDSKGSKSKRKTNSRTPTPVALVLTSETASSEGTPNSSGSGDKKSHGDVVEKQKKPKVETTQSILTNQPVVALTSISTIKTISHTPTSSTVTDSIGVEATPSPSLPPQSIIQSGATHTVTSLVVSVPLTSTSLSPHNTIINNQTSVVIPTPTVLQSEINRISPDRSSNHQSTSVVMTGGNSNQGSNIISSEVSSGGLKIAYEKQDAVTTEVDMELEVSPSTQESSKRSHLVEKSEKGGRGKKRNSGANGIITQLNNTSISTTKRSRAAQNSTTSPQPGAFASISQSQIKDSPPSSPSSESQQGVPSHSGRGRAKSRKSAPAAMARANSPKDTKDFKLFQNGVNAPHMLGNQLNPNSNMAQKMSDHLNSELEAHSIFNPSDNANIVGPQLHHKVIASARASSAGGSSTASGASGFSSMLGGGGGNIPQTLDQLLERQWEQGSQFLMEQAQHFDIASLLSCLYQLRAENLRLEEHVSSLLQRRDHLLAVNARLAIPLTGQPATPQSSHPHTVNNIHPSVANHGDVPRSSRHSSSVSSYPAHPQGSQHASQVVENGLPPEAVQSYPQHSHRSPAASQSQPSPSIRHSPAGSGYPNSGLLRQNADTSGRSAPRPQPYPLYQGQGPSSQQQMVIRRDSEMHHQPSSKPS